MHVLSDMDLLKQYAKDGSETAFAELISRHLDLVYSAALRKTLNPHAAEEITQAVFIILAQKAGRIPQHTILPGWLHQTARLTAANYLKGEARRVRREQEAYMETQIPTAATDEAWEQLAPHLEDAMGRLNEIDRAALVLRFFKNKSFAEVGAAAGVTENAAKKRVNRALEKLHKYFSKQGVISTTAIIAGAISSNSIQAAPAALAKTVTAVAIVKGAAASSSTLILIKGTLKLMAWTKAKMIVVAGAAILVAATTGTVIFKAVENRAAPKLQLDHAPSQVVLETYCIEVPESDVAAILKAGTAINTADNNSVEILDNDKAYRLFRSRKWDALATPYRVTTLSGRQTSMHFGKASVDVLPTVLDDGFTLKMQITATASETLTAKVNICDWQAVALGSQKSDGQSRLFVFIITTLIDPTGNRLHSEAELPFKPGTIPPQ